MISITLKHFIVLLTIYYLNASNLFCQDNITLNSFETNTSSINLKIKSKSHLPVSNSNDKYNYFETVFLGIGIFTNSAYYALNGGYTKQLGSFLSIGLGFNIYEKLKKRDSKPPPSIDLSVLYTRKFLKNNLILLTGAGPAFFLMTTFAGIFKFKLAYNVFKNVYLGSEVQCYLVKFEFYETPLVLINSTFIF
jgi:hypothetical protein